MDSLPHNDPFLWDVGAVSKALCAPNSPWIRDPTALAIRIAEEEISGRLLLTFEYLYSRIALMEILGMKTAIQKLELAEAIVKLQKSSPEFKRWKQDFMKDETAPVETAPVEAASLPEGEPNLVSEPTPLTNLSEAPAEVSATTASETPASPIQVPVVESQLPQGPSEQPPEDERPVKRRRMAPTVLSNAPLSKEAANIPIEGFIFGKNTRLDELVAEEAAFSWEHPDAHAYLGRGALKSSAIRSATTPVSSYILDLDEIKFAVPYPNSIPPGRRLAISRVLRKTFIKNSRKEALLEQNLAPMRSPTPSDDGSEILSLPDSWDEQTLREMAAEEAEREDLEREQARHLTRDRVEAILKDALEQIKVDWEERKLPKCRQKAYKLWTKSRRQSTVKEDIYQARCKIDHYDHRIKKMWGEMLDMSWLKESELRFQTNIFQQNVEDRLYNVWLYNLLESRVEPPKPKPGNRPKPSVAISKKTNVDDELLTSSDEDDFIVPDDGDDVLGVDIDERPHKPSLPLSPTTSPRNEHSIYIDLTQADSPPYSPKAFSPDPFVDLTIPIKQPVKTEENLASAEQESDILRGSAPPLEELQNLRAIAEIPSAQWARENDRWRLLITLLWKLTQCRRTWVFDLILTQSPTACWQDSIQKHVSQPPTAADIGHDQGRTSAFDLTRIFLSFVRCKVCREDRTMTISAKDEKKLQRGRNIFQRFVVFVQEIMPKFPQDNQIFRTDAFDAELEGVDDDDDEQGLRDEEGGTSTKRRHAAREIVQNKDAVDMRELATRRQKEQEARRSRLRTRLANMGGPAVTNARLIINDAKQEHQSFIYVNDHIGRRIKSHQIDGVRFLWDHLITAADVGQGCLLAHTMGLGKTMQVITFLVTVMEASKSSDEQVRNQIPESLRNSKTLVLCPAGLVDNWMDELLIWTTDGILGDFCKIDAQLSVPERYSTVQSWNSEGGVLVIGYGMFKNICEGDKEIEDLLLQSASVVVADEAHFLKNPKTKVHQACLHFKTRSRIALTGSPLSNNVEEYHSMIEWVAPNFLGPLQEFRDIYATKIHQGFWGDSTAYERRVAAKLLEVLKQTVSPKIHRATVKTCLAKDLPPKSEYVICVPPTPLQVQLYQLYIDNMAHNRMLFSTLNDLALVCNHPICFRQKATEIRNVLQGRTPDMTGKEPSFPSEIISTVLKETNGPGRDDPRLSLKVELLLLILDEARKLQDKVLVFSQSIPTLNYLENLLKMQQRRVCRLDGNTAIGKRQDMIKNFNSGSQEVYLISTNAGGVGLNIQGANRVVIFDFKWNPVNDQQAIGRAYRIGQEKRVFVYRFLVAGTFEEDLQNQAVYKTQLASRVVDQKNPISRSNRDLKKLFHAIETKPASDLQPFLGKDVILDRLIKHKSNGQAIRHIVSTDTFDEEDAQYDLTAEEKKETETMAQMIKMRHSDPEGYRKLKAEEELREQNRLNLMAASVMTGNYQPPNIPGLAAVAQAAAAHAAAVHATASLPAGSQAVVTRTYSEQATPGNVVTGTTVAATTHRLDGASDLPNGRPSSAQPSGYILAGAHVC